MKKRKKAPGKADKPGRFNRRDFLEVLGLAAAATVLPACTLNSGGINPGTGKRETRVCLAGVPKGSPDQSLMETVREAAESATNFSWLSRGDAVLIKPALNSPQPYPATTSPVGIQAMVGLLKEKGAKKVILSDMSGIEHVRLSPDGLRGSSRKLMEQCGMAQAALAAGAELYFPEEDGWDAFFEDTPAPGSNWKNPIMMPKIVQDVDHIILMPRCGRHLLAGSSLGMKAAVGYWRTDSRLEYHRDASTFQEKTAEANTVSCLKQKQRLVLTTATRILTTFGPDKGYVTEPETGLIIASESLVAHDMVALAWLLENRRLTPEDEKRGVKDPYSLPRFVNSANKIVVKWLRLPGHPDQPQDLIQNDINSIWDDRVLNRAFQLWGGIPDINLTAANKSVPEGVIRDLRLQTGRHV